MKLIQNAWIFALLSTIASVVIYLIITRFVEMADFKLGLYMSIGIPAVIAYPISNLLINNNRKIESQKLLIQKINKEIIDSITYVKRIQSAILTPKNLFQKHFENSFVLYKPKDIVAGDFFWLEPIENGVLFAAADCIGHGVSGAMVSVICNNALNRSVREFGKLVPGDILDQTREIILQEFEKGDEEVQDGMDIALCSIKGDQLTYAGANIPLWIIRNGEIIEVKPDKQPIGKFHDHLLYRSHSVQLEKGDCIYLFSDGYSDQFGGEHDKKFKVKAFRELLLQVHTKPFDEQGTILNYTLEKWKGPRSKQTDDILVLGIGH